MRESTKWVYICFYRWNHRHKRSVGIPVGKSAGDCATSLYRDPDLNPSVFPSVKSSEKNQRYHTVALFKNLHDASAIQSVYTDNIRDIIIYVGKNY
jgi:hypothetical protein